MQITAARVATFTSLAAAGIAGKVAFDDVRDGQRDSTNGYIGYGAAAALGASLLGDALPGAVGRGVAGASIFSAVLGGGAIGYVLGNASK